MALLGVSMSAGSAAAAQGDLIARGAYLASAGDCAGCHTAKDGKPLAGGFYLDTPFGSLSTPNITPDKATGIGAWTDEQFYRAMHDGIGHRGEYLYPAMPFPWYAIVTRDDVMAIRAWLAAQPAVNQPRPPNKLHFPYSIRESLLAWREVFFRPKTFTPDPRQSAEVNRGAYLVKGLTHCGECHNGRPVAGTSKWREALQGGTIDDWYAPNITSDVRDGIGGWTNPQIATFLKTGSAPGKGVAVGPMSETIHSLSKLTDADLLAIAAYLKTTPPKEDNDKKWQLYAGPHARGAGTYLSYCSSCHGLKGQGLAGVVPALNGDSLVLSKGPQNVISIVIGGLPAHGQYAPMPGVGAGLTDEQVADVTNYVRQAWANAAPPTAMTGTVGSARAAASKQGCAKIGPSALAVAIQQDRDGMRTELSAVTEDNMTQSAKQIVKSAKAAVPGIKQADLINGLTAAYCDVVHADTALDFRQKSLRLGNFSELVFMSATGTWW